MGKSSSYELTSYHNDTLMCEGKQCLNHTWAEYIPFCKDCFHDAMNKTGGLFQSRDGKWYRYENKVWRVDLSLNKV